MHWTRFYHGKPVSGIRCTKCDMKRSGIVYRQDFYWTIKLNCGHTVLRGFVLPRSELIRLGYVNRTDGTRDPRAVAATAQIIHDAKVQFEARKKKRWLEENLATPKKYH